MENSNILRSGHAVIGQLVAFEATTRLGSFRAAADEMHITTGAVAQQIRLLEERLGMKLFERLPRGTRLLAEAEGFSSKIQVALGLINEATRDIERLQRSTDSGALTLSTTGAFASRWLIPKLAHLSETEPGLLIMIDASEATRPLHGINAVDMAIRWGPPPSGGYHATLFQSGKSIAVSSPALKKAFGWKTLSDIAHGVTLISDSHDNWARWFKAAKLKSTASVQRFSQTSLAIEAAEQGLGIALVPEVLVAAALASGTLVRALSPRFCFDTGAGFYLLTATKPNPESKLGKLVRWLIKNAS